MVPPTAKTKVAAALGIFADPRTLVWNPSRSGRAQDGLELKGSQGIKDIRRSQSFQTLVIEWQHVLKSQGCQVRQQLHQQGDSHLHDACQRALNEKESEYHGCGVVL